MEVIINSPKYGEKVVLIDDEDYDKVKDYTWGLKEKRGIFCAVSNIKSKIIYMHRLIMEPPSNLVIDHINNNALDNRRCNLRICTSRENSLNCLKRTMGTSNYKGVHYDKSRSKYAAAIMVNRKKIHLGRFNTEDKAAIAYNIAAVKYFGEFARPNNNIMMYKGI